MCQIPKEFRKVFEVNSDGATLAAVYQRPKT
jgi:hypothetical protein